MSFIHDREMAWQIDRVYELDAFSSSYYVFAHWL